MLRWLAGPGWHKCAAWLQFSAGSASLVDGYDCSDGLSRAELLLVPQRRRGSRANPISWHANPKLRPAPRLRFTVVRPTAPSATDGLAGLRDGCSPGAERSPHSTVQQPIKHGRCCNPRTIRIGHTSHSSPNYIKWRNSWSLRFARAPCCSSLRGALA